MTQFRHITTTLLIKIIMVIITLYTTIIYYYHIYIIYHNHILLPYLYIHIYIHMYTCHVYYISYSNTAMVPPSCFPRDPAVSTRWILRRAWHSGGPTSTTTSAPIFAPDTKHKRCSRGWSGVQICGFTSMTFVGLTVAWLSPKRKLEHNIRESWSRWMLMLDFAQWWCHWLNGY